MRTGLRALLVAASLLIPATLSAATLTIINADAAGEGFNSTAAATPVGGNTGATLGEQRLIVFQRAADIWGQRLTSAQTIKIEARFDALFCNGSSAVLGSAGPDSFFVHSFSGVQRLVPVALREALAGANLNTTEPEIVATFNSDIDTGCLGAQRWWYGIDPNVAVPANRIPLLNTLLHELGHGLGFISLVCLDPDCSINGVSWPRGGYPDDIKDRWADFQRDRVTTQLWATLTNAQRFTSATSGNSLVWDGSNVTGAYPSVPVAAAGLNNGRVKLYAPGTLELGSSVSHFTRDSNAPDLLMEPVIGSTGRPDQVDLTSALFRDLGWTVSGGSAPTSTAITSDTPDPSATGAAYVVSSTVTNLGATGSVSGTVSVTDGVSSCTTPALVSGAGSCSLTSTTSGAKTLVATYSGNTTLAPSSDVEAHQVNNVVNTTTVINSDTPDPSLVGQSYTVTVTVARSSGSGAAPGGTVTVSEGVNTCTVTLASGTGSCALLSSVAGTRSLVASYAGSSGFNASTSATASHLVNKASTAISITADTPDPSVSGQPVATTFNLTVSGAGSGTPGGTVTISGNGGDSCVAILPATSCNIVLGAVGTRTLTASYSGDSNFNSSSSSTVSHTVTKANTSVSISADTPDPSVVGQPVIVSAAVIVTAPGSGTPAGTVTITTAGSAATCSYTLPATSCALALDTAGARQLTASYSGDANFNASTSSTSSHTVTKANTSISILSDTPDPAPSGTAFTVTFQLLVTAPGAGTPGGTVTVTASGGIESCVAVLPATSCMLTLLTTGPRTLTASYSGDSNFNSALSANVPHTVSLAVTTTTITSHTPDPSVFGQSYNVAVNVSAGASPLAGSIVNINDGAGVSCIASLDAAGNGACNLLSGAPGGRTLRATYPSSPNSLSSFDTASHTINKATSTLTLISDLPDPSNPGQNVTVRFAVAAAPPGVGTPNGMVSVTASATETCSATLPATSCIVALTELGTRTLTATYAGDSNFNASTPVGTSHEVTDGQLDGVFADGFE